MKDSTFKKYCLVVDEWFVNGFNGTKAVKTFYPNHDDNSAGVKWNELLRITKIQEYKESKQLETSSKLQITLESQLQELQELKQLAKEDNRFNDAINAVKEQNKLLALYKEHNEQQSQTINTIVQLGKGVKPDADATTT